MDALECLQRAFEVAINFCVYNKGADLDVLKLRYDTELLITGKKSKKTLTERYTEEKRKTSKKSKKSKKDVTVFPLSSKDKKSKPAAKKSKKQYHTMSSRKKKQGIPVFWVLVGISLLVSVVILILMFLISL